MCTSRLNKLDYKVRKEKKIHGLNESKLLSRIINRRLGKTTDNWKRLEDDDDDNV